MKRILAISLSILCSAVAPSAVAAADTKIEQTINIIDQLYSTTDTVTSAPTDNSLGLVYWESGKYNGETVYFEAIAKCESCTGGNTRASVGLYTSSGTLVTGATLTTTSTSYVGIRSGDITSNLTNGTNYTIRIKVDADSGTASVISARLIIAQSADPITHTQNQIELGSAATTISTTSGIISYPKIFRFDEYYYDPDPTAYFEATMKSSTADGIAYAYLADSSDCSTYATNGSVNTTGTTWNRVRSSALTLTTGNSYFVCIKSSAGDVTASIANAKLILDSSDNSGISTSLIVWPIATVLHETSSTSFVEFPNWISYNPANFDGKYFSYFYESTLKGAGPSAKSDLYNSSSTAIISPSEVTNAGSAYARKRSNELIMPTSSATLGSRIVNSGGNLTSQSGANLLIYMFSDPILTFSVAGVNGGVTNNGITTSKTSTYNELGFGNLIVSTPRYMAHKLTVTTNASSGYDVWMKMISTLQGNYPANIIEEFPEVWSAPDSWYEPDGTSPNVNSGWIGANTSDTRVSGWSDGSAKFAGVGSSSRLVMTSPGIDIGTDVYVTYAIEVNRHQPTDLYAGNIMYTIVPQY